ncbi:MAG: 2-oxo acid dehydrogenase subunit E2 [Microbacteriaceae bacterium]|nr:2-oxo acid dehydrogenase subunit E2 [Microbacteriaceae bacterium]
MPEVVMPRLSDTMEEGELSKWLKNEGDEVVKGDILAEIETDKATMDLEAFESGVLEKHLVEAGTVVAIGTPVAIIGDGSGAKASPAKKTPSKAKESSKSEDEPPAVEPSAEESPKSEDESLVEESPKATSRNQEPADSAEAGDVPTRPRMSPFARKIAKDHGLDPATIAGSGPQGRVVRADVEAAISSTPGEAATRASAPATIPTAADEEIPVNRIRKVVAKRLTESQAVPHFFLTSIVDVERLLAFRVEVNEALESQGIKVSVNDLFVRAAAVALHLHPEANSSWGNDSIIRRANINVGIAVATETGLFVPVVRNADRKDLATIAAETVALAGKARDGKLTPDEMSGGTFSISNLGMFGIDQFTAVINPPEAAILAVGAASPVPVVRDGQLVEVPKLKITLTVDHRVMDGAEAAGFLRDLVEILEQPLRIIL